MKNAKRFFGFFVCVFSLLAQASISDTYANVASTACGSSNLGQVALTTDGIYTGRCNGAAWDWYYQGVHVIPPPTTGWTLESQSGSTVTANADGTVTFYFARRGTVALDAAYRSGSSSQTITALLCSDLGNVIANSTDVGNDTASSIGFRDLAGRYESLWATIGSLSDQPPKYYITIDDWTSATNYASNITYVGEKSGATSAVLVDQTCHWRRIRETGTLIAHDWNLLGAASGWIQFYQGNQFAFLGSGVHSPAVIGYDYGNGQRITLVSWDQQ